MKFKLLENIKYKKTLYQKGLFVETGHPLLEIVEHEDVFSSLLASKSIELVQEDILAKVENSTEIAEQAIDKEKFVSSKETFDHKESYPVEEKIKKGRKKRGEVA